MKESRDRGVLDVDTKVPAAITAYAPGYIAPDLEQIVGLQTDQPLKRAIMPLGGIRVVRKSMAHKLGSTFHVPHGLANALMISHVIRHNATDAPFKSAIFPQYEYPQVSSAMGALPMP